MSTDVMFALSKEVTITLRTCRTGRYRVFRVSTVFVG